MVLRHVEHRRITGKSAAYTASFKVDGQAQTETWHSNVVEEAGPATGAIIHREITIPDQQNELAVEFVTEYTCNLIVQFR